MTQASVFRDSVLVARVINRMSPARLRRFAMAFGHEQTAAYVASVAARRCGFAPMRALAAAEQALPVAYRAVTGRAPLPGVEKRAREHLRRVILG